MTVNANIESQAGDAPKKEAVILIGIQATGKSTFFCGHYCHTHVRINLDMLGTRHREDMLLKTCVDYGIPFVVDNTNPTSLERAKYIQAAKAAGFRVVGFYFESKVSASLERNAARARAEQIPERGIKGTAARLELPRLAEGFDQLNYVRIEGGGKFMVDEWRDEI
jgi:predicted kinase